LVSKLRDLKPATVIERLAKQVILCRAELESLNPPEAKEARSMESVVESEQNEFEGRFPAELWRDYKIRKAALATSYQAVFDNLGRDIDKRLTHVTRWEEAAGDLVVAAHACKSSLRALGLYHEKAHPILIAQKVKPKVRDSVVYTKFEELAKESELFDEVIRREEEKRLERFQERSHGNPLVLFDTSIARNPPRTDDNVDFAQTFFYLTCCEQKQVQTASLKDMASTDDNRLVWIPCSNPQKSHKVVIQCVQQGQRIAWTGSLTIEPTPVSVSHTAPLTLAKGVQGAQGISYKATIDATRDFDANGQPLGVKRKEMRKLFGDESSRAS
jgi:hypothetical protein